MKITPSGIGVTPKFLTVGLRVDFGGAVRFSEVKVPIADLAASDVRNIIEDFVAADLRDTWRQAQGVLPLEVWE